MTNEELVQDIQKGDKDLLPSLWEQVSGFAAQQAFKWSRAFQGSLTAEYEDLYQRGR